MHEKGEEKKVLVLMIDIYCKGRHYKGNKLCNTCKDLLAYASEKLDNCPFENKPNCSDCKIHCYDDSERDSIRNVMKYSGKRRIIKHHMRKLNR